MSALLFERRCNRREWMDNPRIDYETLTETLRDLAFMNTITVGHWPLQRTIGRFWRRYPAKRSWSLLDLGSGYGDTLRSIHRFACARQRTVRLSGIDRNPLTVQTSRASTPSTMDIDFYASDVLNVTLPEQPDLITSNLLMHHLRESEVVRMLKWMTAQARYGWIITDLHRHPMAYALFNLITGVVPVNPVIRHDGKISILRGFTRGEWLEMISRAGLSPKNISIRWYPNFRYVIAYEHKSPL